MPQTLAKSMNEQMLGILDLYFEQGGKVPWSLDDLASFAMNNGHWTRHRQITWNWRSTSGAIKLLATVFS